MKYTSETIGFIIKESREIAGISLTDFAKIIGEDKSNLSKIEQGKLNIKLDRFLNIINNLSISVCHCKKNTINSKNSILKEKIDPLKVGETIIVSDMENNTVRLYLNTINKTGIKKFATKKIGINLMIIRTN